MTDSVDQLRFSNERIEPTYIEFADADDMWIRFYEIPKGNAAPQHSHEHDHLTLLCRGVVVVYKDNELVGNFAAPSMITIHAGSKHMFIAVTDDVLLACVHNLRGRGEQPTITEYHELPKTS
jgi:hypothetical protein